MTTTSPSPRRQFLLGLGGLGASIAAARPASAFQVLPTSDYAGLIDQSCGVTPAHRRLLEDARARLGVTLTDAQMNEALAALRCPICGCPLVVAADDRALPDQPPATEARHE